MEIRQITHSHLVLTGFLESSNIQRVSFPRFLRSQLHDGSCTMYYREGSPYSPRSSSPSENRRSGSNSSYLYNVLGVLKSANQNQIRRAYKKKAMLFHPDKGGDLRRVGFVFGREFIFSSKKCARRTRYYLIQTSGVNTILMESGRL